MKLSLQDKSIYAASALAILDVAADIYCIAQTLEETTSTDYAKGIASQMDKEGLDRFLRVLKTQSTNLSTLYDKISQNGKSRKNAPLTDGYICEKIADYLKSGKTRVDVHLNDETLTRKLI